ncbi:CBN-UGT-63 protein [Caenorhabditis brenneri]|uniref:glucuronosyltransferase n=1 Tax=Caenorhabditis brenneri TaxID=135651 RepID=G0MS61_CAEBE|nr:CBN-UGT-63 protein [Caenorhabditis brenneri]
MHRLQKDNHTTALEFAMFHPDIDFGMEEQFIEMGGFQNPFASPDFDKIAFDEEYSFIHQAVAYGFGSETCNNILSHRRDRFFEILNEGWDLYMSDSLFAVCGYGMAEISGKPHVMMHSTDLEAAQGSFKAFSRNYATFVPSNLPFTMLDFTVSKFQHRVWATYDWFGSFIFTAFVGNFAQKWALRSIIPSPYFSFSEYNRRSSFSFTDMPDSLFPPASRTNDFFSFGAYCKSSHKPLDAEFKTFIEDPKSKGTILIAFGTFIDWRKAPDHYYEAFSTVVNQLTDYRVIWSMKGDRPSGLGKHVKTAAWVPQNQILHHNKTVLFLSHGGLKSTKEAICSATPTIFVPMFGEQTRNAWLIQEKGFGRIMNKFKIDEDVLGTHVNEVLLHPDYQNNANKFLTHYMDQPIPTLDEGAFKFNRLIKYGGKMPSPVTSLFLNPERRHIRINEFKDEFMESFRVFSPAVFETVDLLAEGQMINEVNELLGDYFRFYSQGNRRASFVEISPNLLELGRRNLEVDARNMEALADHQLQQLREIYHNKNVLPSPPPPEPDFLDYASEFRLNQTAVNTGPEKRTGGVPKSRVKRSPPRQYREPYSGGPSRHQNQPSYPRSPGRSPSTSNRRYQTSQQEGSSQFSSSVSSRGGYSGGFSNMRYSKDPRSMGNAGQMHPREAAPRFSSFRYDEPGTSYSSSDPQDDSGPLFQPGRQHRPHESSSEYGRHRSTSIHRHRFNEPHASREAQFRFPHQVSSDNRYRETDRRESWSESAGRSRLESREESSFSRTPASSRRPSSDEQSSVYFSAPSEFESSEDRVKSSAYKSDFNRKDETSQRRLKTGSSHISANSRDSDEFSSMDEAFAQEKDSDRRSDYKNSSSRRFQDTPVWIKESKNRISTSSEFDVDEERSFRHARKTRDFSTSSSGASQASMLSFNPNASPFIPHTAPPSQSTTSSLFSERSYSNNVAASRHDRPNRNSAESTAVSNRPEERKIVECVRCEPMMCNSNFLIRCWNCKRVQCPPNHYIPPEFQERAKLTCFHCHAPLDKSNYPL